MIDRLGGAIEGVLFLGALAAIVSASDIVWYVGAFSLTIYALVLVYLLAGMVMGRLRRDK